MAQAAFKWRFTRMMCILTGPSTLNPKPQTLNPKLRLGQGHVEAMQAINQTGMARTDVGPPGRFRV